MTPRNSEDYLQDILDAINAAQQFVAEMTFDEFEQDQKTIFAVTRAIEIIGEAAKNVDSDLQNQYLTLPWKGMAGIRDKLIHHYFGVNLIVLWDTIQQDLPPLKVQISQLIENLKS